MDDNCGEWVESMGVVVRRYIDFLILLIPVPLVSVLFYSSIPTFCSFLKCIYIIRQSGPGGPRTTRKRNQLIEVQRFTCVINMQ